MSAAILCIHRMSHTLAASIQILDMLAITLLLHRIYLRVQWYSAIRLRTLLKEASAADDWERALGAWVPVCMRVSVCERVCVCVCVHVRSCTCLPSTERIICMCSYHT